MIFKTTIPRLPGTKTSIVNALLVLSVALAVAPSAAARENPVTAIALFDGPSAPAYVQITGLLLNGKSELRVCDGVPKMNKMAYDNLLHTQLASGTVLERGTDGVLSLTVNSKPVCIVPSNLKFE